jgi:Mg-chelatase subunit ChlD
MDLINRIIRMLEPGQSPPVRAAFRPRSPALTVHHRNTARPLRRGTDLVGVLGFHHIAFPISLPAEPWGDLLTKRVATLPSRVGGKGTNIAAALRHALEMCKKAPAGTQRRIWLLSDGEANQDQAATIPAAQAIAASHINVNTIGFGDAFNSPLLKQIAGTTHNGKAISVASLHEMSEALTRGSRTIGTKHSHRQEVTIIAVDCSLSMNEPMLGVKKIEVVRQAITDLLKYKARTWA